MKFKWPCYCVAGKVEDITKRACSVSDIPTFRQLSTRPGALVGMNYGYLAAQHCLCTSLLVLGVRTIVWHRQTAAELKIDMVDEPHGNLRLLRRRMVVVIYEITNEVSDGCTGQGVGRVMPPTSEASDTHGRCGSVRYHGNPPVGGGFS